MNSVSVLLDLKNKLSGQMGEAVARLKTQAAAMQAHAGKASAAQLEMLRSAQTEIPGLSRGLDLLTNKYTLVGAGVTAVGAGIFKAMAAADEWDRSMRKLNVTAQLKPDELQRLSNDMLDIGRRIPVELDDIPRAMDRLVSSGMSVPTAKAALEPVLKAAKAFETDSDVVAAAMANVMASSGNNSTTEVMDILAATQQKGNAEFSDIANYLPKIIPVARAAGISLKDTAAQFAFLTAQGLKSEQAATAMENLGLAFTDTKVKANFKGMGVQLYDNGKLRSTIDIIQDIKKQTAGLSEEAKNAKLDKLGLNQQTGIAIKSMLLDTDKLKTITEEMQNPAGALSEAYKNSWRASDDLKRIWNEIKVGFIKAGQALWGFFAPDLGWIRANLPEIKLFVEGIVKVVGMLALGWLALKAPILIARGAVMLFNLAANMNPFGWVVLAIAGIAMLYSQFESVRFAVAGLWEVIKGFFVNIWEAMKSWVAALASPFKAIWKAVQGDFKGALSELKNGASSGVNVFMKLNPLSDDMKGRFAKGWSDREKHEAAEKAAEAKEEDYGLQAQPPSIGGIQTGASSPDLSTSKVTETGGSAKSIVINIDKLAAIELKTTLEKSGTNSDIERVVSDTLLKALRQIELSYN